MLVRLQDETGVSWLPTSHAVQVVACSISLRIVDAVLRFRNPRIEFSVVSETLPETSSGRTEREMLNTWKNFMLIL